MRTVRWLLAALASTVPAACGGANGEGSPPHDTLTGLFRLDAGRCGTNGADGSYFRMVQPNGSVTSGPFVTNGDSTCSNKTWTPLSPGKDGGLRTGVYQPQPSPAFNGGDSASGAILEPQRFFAVRFGPSTNPKDPQTGTSVSAPTVTLDGRRLRGDLRSFSVSWNGQQFNQGSPKPDGSAPGGTSPVTGTYDASTRAFVLTWSSQIVGGPFNNFIGTWRLQGTFVPA